MRGFECLIEPEEDWVIFTGAKHILVIIWDFNMAHWIIVADVFAQCLETDILITGTVVINAIDESHISTNCEFVATLRMVLEWFYAVDNIWLHFSFAISSHFFYGVKFNCLFLSLNVSHVDNAFKRTWDNCLLIIREVTFHDAWLALFVLKDRLGKITCVPQAEKVITTNRSNLGHRIICHRTIQPSCMLLQSRSALSRAYIPQFCLAVWWRREKSLTILEIVEAPDSLIVALHRLQAFATCVPDFNWPIVRSWSILSIP